MIKFIIFVLVAAAAWFAYTNLGTINKSMDKTIQNSATQIKQEKMINTVQSTRQNTADDVNSVERGNY